MFPNGRSINFVKKSLMHVKFWKWSYIKGQRKSGKGSYNKGQWEYLVTWEAMQTWKRTKPVESSTPWSIRLGSMPCELSAQWLVRPNILGFFSLENDVKHFSGNMLSFLMRYFHFKLDARVVFYTRRIWWRCWHGWIKI
jgi:hypothetical protein